MLLGGDERRRTQRGNNNAYNQDNATSWFDWTPSARADEIFRFTQQMIAFRKCHPALSRPLFYNGAIKPRGRPDITWHGTRLGSPGFGDPEARALGCTIAGIDGSSDLHVMMNMYWEPLDFEVPGNAVWHVAIDTFAVSPNDIASGHAVAASGSTHRVQGRSIVVLESARS